MNDTKDVGHDEIALLLLKLVTGGQANEAQVAEVGVVPGPKLVDADALIAASRAKKGW